MFFYSSSLSKTKIYYRGSRLSLSLLRVPGFTGILLLFEQYGIIKYSALQKSTVLFKKNQ